MGARGDGRRAQRRADPDRIEEIKTLDTRLRERNEYWTRLLTAMGDGDPTAYKTLQGTDVIEFYYLYRAHQERIERLNSSYKKATPACTGPTTQPRQ